MHEIIYNHMNNCENFIKPKMIQVEKLKKLIKMQYYLKII